MKLRSPAHGTVELLLSESANADELIATDSGHRERFVRLPEPAPAIATDLAKDLVGRYRYADFDREFDIVLDDGTLFLDLRPLYGRSRLRIEVLSNDVCACTLTGTFPIPVPMFISFSIERRDGQVTGLWLNGARTRDLWLERRIAI